MDTPKIDVESPASAEKSAALHDGLADAGQTLSDEEMPSFLLSVTDPDGKMTAGCKGEIAFTSAHISELWVDAAHRGQGTGGALLKAAETHVKAQGCSRIHLETRNEKARRLYERLGYRVFGTLENYEGDQAFYYLEKPLS